MCLTLVEKMHTRHGGILQVQLGGKTRIVLQQQTAYALCGDSVYLLDCMVLFSLTDQKKEKYGPTMKSNGLALSKSALCLVQFKSRDNQECLFDNSIYNALF